MHRPIQHGWYKGAHITVVTGESFQEGIAKNIEIDIALEGCAILNRMDQAKGSRTYWHPGVGLD